MKPQTPTTPTTYDAITRRTAMGTDGLIHPLPDPPDPPMGDTELYTEVDDLLTAVGHGEIGHEVVAGHVLLRGHVRDQVTIDRIIRLIRTRTGAEIDNQMHV